MPLNGRNFEYMAGEDPYLGYEAAFHATAGIQSQGVRLPTDAQSQKQRISELVYSIWVTDPCNGEALHQQQSRDESNRRLGRHR